VAAPIELRSDNTAGVSPEILQAITEANVGGAAAYGADEWTARLGAVVAEVFEHDDAAVFPVASGTAANSLALSAMCPPWGSVLCHETAHIMVNECGATSMFSGGAVMRGLRGDGPRLSPAAIERACSEITWGDPHHSQPSVVSLTSPTDHGTVYQVAEVAAIAAFARSRGLKVHLDGARIANAIASLGCSPAELTWRAGVDVVSLGAIKNGGMSCDAIVSFDRAVSEQLVYRTKRAGHVASKMRFQSAQLLRYLSDGLWLRNAGAANAAMARLAAGLRTIPGISLLHDVDVNMAFVSLGTEDAVDRLEATDVRCYRYGGGVVRFVTSFATTDDDVDRARCCVESAAHSQSRLRNAT
jgi:threonine aldolase